MNKAGECFDYSQSLCGSIVAAFPTAMDLKYTGSKKVNVTKFQLMETFRSISPLLPRHLPDTLHPGATVLKISDSQPPRLGLSFLLRNK